MKALTDQKQFRPFQRLGQYLSDSFRIKVERWMNLVTTNALRKLEKHPETDDEWQMFFSNCHDDWKLVQKEIAAFLVETLQAKATAQIKAKELRTQKLSDQLEKVRTEIQNINLQITVARRTLDIILWAIFSGDHSTLRRLHLTDGEHSLSQSNIEVAMLAAAQLNEDPAVMALATDMLSFVHVGDLIVVNKKTGAIDFVELKSGSKNARLVNLAVSATQTDDPTVEQVAMQSLNAQDRKHYDRIKRQYTRNAQIMATLENESGVDPNTGAQIRLRPTSEPAAFWSDRIQKCVAQITDKKTWAIDTIDTCVHIGVYSDPKIAFVAFSAWLSLINCTSAVFNLTDSFFNPAVRPLGAMFLAPETLRKVLNGEVTVVLSLDVAKLIELGNSLRDDFLRLSTRAESAKLRQRGVGGLTLDGRYVQATVHGQTATLGLGIQDRILFDQQRPTQILKQHIESGDFHP